MPDTTEQPPPAPNGPRRVAGTGGRAARALGRGASGTVRTARRLTHAHGAGESGLARLLEMHAVSTAGDAAVAVALAGTLFFQVPTGEARGQVAQFLVLTMVPFAIVAPLIGPFLDRFRRGRRWALGSTMAVRGFCCWVLAGAVTTESPTLFLAALGVLVAAKAYGVTKASAVPRLVPPDLTLVKTNSRLALTGTAAAALSAPIAALLAQIGAEWALRYAFCLFVVATVLAVLLPSTVDASAGEEQVGLSDVGGDTREGRRAGVTPMVVFALRGNAGLRFLSGFLVMYMAFLLRERPFEGWEDRTAILLALVVGAAGAGATIGNVAASLLRSRRPESTVVLVLLADVAMIVLAALFYSLPTAVALGLTAGVCQQLGKLSLDALIQRDVPEAVRTSVFARAETLMQVSWVGGGFVGIALPLSPVRLSLGVVAGLLLVWAFVVLKGLVELRRRGVRNR